MEIKIKENLTDTLVRLASERGQDTQVYLEEYLEAHLISQQKQHLIETIQNQKPEDVTSFEEVIKPVDEAIKIRDTVAPIDTPIEVVTDNEVIK